MSFDSARLELHFAGAPVPSLSKVVLFHPEISSTSIIKRSFPTASGIRGLCILLLTAVQWRYEGVPDESFQIRHYPYLAPVWVACRKNKVKWSDKFLGNYGGQPLLRRLVRAQGKEKSKIRLFDTRKVRVNTNFISVRAIEVYRDNKRVEGCEGIKELVGKLESAMPVPFSRAIPGHPVRSERSGPLKTAKQSEADELEYVKENVFKRIGQESGRADRLLSWAEFFPCSLEPDLFMRAHHESVYREVMGEDSPWRDIVPSYNESGAARRLRLETECAEDKRTWKFVHMMFQSDLERIVGNDEAYKHCSRGAKAELFEHLIRHLKNPAMKLEIGYVPAEHEYRFNRSKFQHWRFLYDSVVRIDANGENLFSFARDRRWRMRELPNTDEALCWLNAVYKWCDFDKTNVIGLLRRLQMKCVVENFK